MMIPATHLQTPIIVLIVDAAQLEELLVMFEPGIGGSTGAIFIVQPVGLSPSFEQDLRSVAARLPVPVIPVREPVLPVPNCIYVISPGSQGCAEGAALALRYIDPPETAAAASKLYCRLAHNWGQFCAVLDLRETPHLDTMGVDRAFYCSTPAGAPRLSGLADMCEYNGTSGGDCGDPGCDGPQEKISAFITHCVQAGAIVDHRPDMLRTALDPSQERYFDLSKRYDATLAALQLSNRRLGEVSEQLRSMNDALQATAAEIEKNIGHLQSLEQRLSASTRNLDSFASVMEEFFGTAQIAAVILDRALQVTFMSRLAREMFPATGGDELQSLDGLAAGLGAPQLRDDLTQVMESGAAVARKIAKGSERILLRAIPSRAAGDTRGVLLTVSSDRRGSLN